jgi:hypothetical protein
LQAAFRQHVFEFTPRGFAFFRGIAAAARTRATIVATHYFVDVLRIIGLGDKLVIEIEVFVVSLHDGFLQMITIRLENLRSTLRLNHPDRNAFGATYGLKILPMAAANGADYIRCEPLFNANFSALQTKQKLVNPASR